MCQQEITILNLSSDHIIPLLCCLHWLRAPQQVTYNFAVLVYQYIHGLVQAYLADTLQHVAQIPGQQRLRLTSTSELAVPPTRLCTISDWAFPIAAAKTWNSLLLEVTSSDTYPAPFRPSPVQADCLLKRWHCINRLLTYFAGVKIKP